MSCKKRRRSLFFYDYINTDRIILTIVTATHRRNMSAQRQRVHWCKEPARISQDRFALFLAQSGHATAESNAMNVAHLPASRFTFLCSERAVCNVARARRLTLRSSRRVPAGRFRPSFHSRPYAPCLHARLNSNVRPFIGGESH